MGANPHKKPYFLGVLAAFLAARSALAEQFLEQTVIGLFFGLRVGTQRPQPSTTIRGISHIRRATAPSSTCDRLDLLTVSTTKLLRRWPTVT